MVRLWGIKWFENYSNKNLLTIYMLPVYDNNYLNLINTR